MATKTSSDKQPDAPKVTLVANHIRQAIQTRKLQPGDLINFPELEEELGISRTPIRESIGRLQADGLIESLPGGQFRVAVLSQKQISDFYAVRLELELIAASMAARQITDRELIMLRRNLEIFREHRHDSELLIRIDKQFHEIIFDATRNRYLSQRLKHLRGILALLPFKAFRTSSRVEQAIAEHTSIVNALSAHDLDAAVESVSTHVRNARDARAVRP